MQYYYDLGKNHLGILIELDQQIRKIAERAIPSIGAVILLLMFTMGMGGPNIRGIPFELLGMLLIGGLLLRLYYCLAHYTDEIADYLPGPSGIWHVLIRIPIYLPVIIVAILLIRSFIYGN